MVVKQKTYNPSAVRFWRNSWQQVYMDTGNGQEGPVVLKRAFPLTDPDEFIIIENQEGSFVGLLKDYHKLDAGSIRVVEEELEHEYFLPQITAINSISDDASVMVWDVETNHGPRKFEVESIHRDVRWLNDKHIVIQDVDGNKYEIRDHSSLDKKSQSKLELKV